jgi:hypothetical protein
VEFIMCKQTEESQSSEREKIMEKWRAWTFDKGDDGEEARLRKIISAAYLRLERLDNSNPEVCHAKQLLECAITGDKANWP